MLQMTEATEEDCKQIVESCELISEWKHENCLGVDGTNCNIILFNEDATGHHP